MRTLITSRILLALAAPAILLTQPALKAQAPSTAVVANIPFAFQVGSYHYAAGKYTVQMPMDRLLSIQGPSGSGTMQVMRQTTSHPSAKSTLVFHHYGNQYFLSELHIGNNQEFLKATQSKAERRAKLEQEASNRTSNPKSLDAEIALLAPSR